MASADTGASWVIGADQPLETVKEHIVHRNQPIGQTLPPGPEGPGFHAQILR